MAGWNPERLCLTHFGPVTEVEDHLHRMRTALLDGAEVARDADEEEFIRDLDTEMREATDAEAAERFEQAAPPDQLFKGLERYWRKTRRGEGGVSRGRRSRRPRVDEPGSGVGGNWRVIVLNDDHNTFDGVARRSPACCPG